MEHHMDVDMFLDGYIRWEVGSPHQSIILHEMFLHATEQGQKGVEWMIPWGHQHGLPKLDPQVDISAIQSVGPQTSREEFRDLYYQMYKHKRLPGSPPCWPEQMEELTANVVSSMKDCLRWKDGKPLWGSEKPGPADVQPSRSKTPRRGRRSTSTERDLAEVREVHQRALVTTATLEEKIERLSWSITQGWLDAHAHSQSCDCWRRRSQGWSRRCCRVGLEESPAPFSEYSPPQWGPESGEDGEAKLPLLDFNLEPLPELGPEVDHFLQELAGSLWEDDGSRSSPEPPVIYQKSTKDGWPGKHRHMICLTGGHS